MVSKIKNKNYCINKYLFENDKKLININKVDTKQIVLSDKATHGEHGANKNYTGYLNGGFKPLYSFIKDTELYIDNTNVLSNDN